MTAATDQEMSGAEPEAMVLTHGTLESSDLPRARDFYENVLGLRCVQHGPIAQLVAGCVDFGIVNVNKHRDKISPQGYENRWILSVGDEQAVADIHRKAVESSFCASVGNITRDGGIVRFVIQDGDSNWWDVTSLPADHYNRYFDRSAPGSVPIGPNG